MSYADRWIAIEQSIPERLKVPMTDFLNALWESRESGEGSECIKAFITSIRQRCLALTIDAYASGFSDGWGDDEAGSDGTCCVLLDELRMFAMQHVDQYSKKLREVLQMQEKFSVILNTIRAIKERYSEVVDAAYNKGLMDGRAAWMKTHCPAEPKNQPPASVDIHDGL